MTRDGTTEATATLTAEQIAAAIGRPVAAARRRTWKYCSSHPLQALHIELTDGTTLEVLFKDLGVDQETELARQARPGFIYNSRREIDVYRDLLSRAPQLDAPIFYGGVIDQRPGFERYWLFAERMENAAPLWQCELDAWPVAARWLAKLHAQRWKNLPPSLLRHDHAYYQRWIERAARFNPGIGPLAKNYDRVIDRLLAMPAAVIHGEFYPSNVLVQDGRIRPADWETAALAPALIDLAALCGGKVGDELRVQLAREYGADPVDLDFCRIHLGVQWLGWSDQWKPPKYHAHDWLSEVMSLASKLGVAS